MCCFDGIRRKSFFSTVCWLLLEYKYYYGGHSMARIRPSERKERLPSLYSVGLNSLAFTCSNNREGFPVLIVSEDVARGMGKKNE